MAQEERWICPVCWKSNHPEAIECWHCRSARGIEASTLEGRREEVAREAERPEAIPDFVVAIPVVVFRGYARTWLRGGLGLLVLPLLLGLGGVADVALLLLSGGLAAGLVVAGFLAQEVADAMRDREAWAFVVGVVLAVAGGIGSAFAFDVFAPGLVDPTAVRWGSAIVFGGAALAAAAGLVLMVVRRERLV